MILGEGEKKTGDSSVDFVFGWIGNTLNRST